MSDEYQKQMIEDELNKVADTAWADGWRAALKWAAIYGTMPGKTWPETLRQHATIAPPPRPR